MVHLPLPSQQRWFFCRHRSRHALLVCTVYLCISITDQGMPCWCVLCICVSPPQIKACLAGVYCVSVYLHHRSRHALLVCTVHLCISTTDQGMPCWCVLCICVSPPQIKACLAGVCCVSVYLHRRSKHALLVCTVYLCISTADQGMPCWCVLCICVSPPQIKACLAGVYCVSVYLHRRSRHALLVCTVYLCISTADQGMPCWCVLCICVSPPQIKTCLAGVYCVSVYLHHRSRHVLLVCTVYLCISTTDQYLTC